MKFSCEKVILNDILSYVSRTVAQKSTIQCLEGILIRAGSMVTMTGYDLQTGITATFEAEIDEEGSCVMPAKLFSDIVRKLSDDMVTIYVDEEMHVMIRCGISVFSITAFSPDEYPELPDVENEHGIIFPQKELREALIGTTFSASENKSRPIHTGCKFELADGKASIISCDGFRMSVRQFPLNDNRNISFVVPASALKEVEKILTDDESNCIVTPGEKHVTFSCKGIMLVSRVLEGEFMNWRAVIPNDNTVKVSINRNQIYNILDRLFLMIDEKQQTPLHCEFEENELRVKTSSSMGKGHDICPIAGDGKGIEIGFNCRYMIEAVRAVPDDVFIMEMKSSINSLIMTPADGSDRFYYMVLPVRLKAN